MEIRDDVYSALKILIKISKNAQETLQEQYKFISNIQWIKECCTIKATTARRGGHTTSILKLIEEDEMHIGCIFPNNGIRKIFQHMYNSRQGNRGKLEFCVTIHDLKSNYFDGEIFNKLDALVVDNSFFYSEKDKDMIYQLSCLLGQKEDRTYGNTNKNFFLIFLQ